MMKPTFSFKKKNISRQTGYKVFNLVKLEKNDDIQNGYFDYFFK